jgi:hypothetical protein
MMGVVAFLTELYCASRYINATGCLNTILDLFFGDFHVEIDLNVSMFYIAACKR